MAIANELPLDNTATAQEMAEEIFGAGITINAASYSGDPDSSGIFSDGDAVSGGAVPSDTGVILSTGHADDFTNSSGTSNTNTSAGRSTNTSGVNNDADFNAVSGGSTFDASFLEIDFTPEGSVFTLDFVLSSDEFPEFNSSYNDVIGIWINGVEAQVIVGKGSASVSNITPDNAPNLYSDNTSDQFNTEMDGFTVTLTITAPVNPRTINTLKIGVADGGDANYDTNLLIAGGSAQSSIVAVDDQVTVFNSSEVVDILSNDSTTDGSTITVTQINGIPVSVGDTISLSNGQTVILLAAGRLRIDANGSTETVYFNYTLQNGSAETDTGLVRVDNVALPCFVQESRIATPRGSVPIEDLSPGDLVMTLDNGLQAVRWIGETCVSGHGDTAPVRLRAGTLGADADLYLSPQHRVLVTGPQAELLFGCSEILVAAKHLTNDNTIRQVERQDVRYYYLLLDAHEIVFANGVPTETYYPCSETVSQFAPDAQAELAKLVPDVFKGNTAQSSDGQVSPPLARPETQSQGGILLSETV